MSAAAQLAFSIVLNLEPQFMEWWYSHVQWAFLTQVWWLGRDVPHRPQAFEYLVPNLWLFGPHQTGVRTDAETQSRTLGQAWESC